MKDKSVAALLAFFLGSLGIHKFYLNRPVQGVFYLLFCWTYIPGILGVFEAIRYVLMSKEIFCLKYNSVAYNASSFINIRDNKEENLSESVTENINIINTEKKINISQLQPQIVKEEIKKINVPYWGLKYVYSYNDIKIANSDIRNFYNQFKESFLNQKYIPLAENEMNYAFVLLFDFERDFINSNDFEGLRSNYKTLVKYYPKTRIYCERKLQQYKNLKRSNTSEVVVTESAPIQETHKENVNQVPHWNSGYIYSAKAINLARKDIQDFYVKFKQNFKNRSYIKLEQDNLGYVFTLMFDLEQEHLDNKNYLKLESYYRVLDELYPKVRRYTSSILKNYNSNAISDSYGDLIQNNYNTYNESDYDLGNYYKEKYNFNSKEVKCLNRVGNYTLTTFAQVEFCFKQQCLVFCRSISALEKYCKMNDTTLSARIDELADLLKKFNSNSYYTQYYSDGPILKSYKQEIYRYFFKLTENKVREFYNHKRKLNVEAIHSKSEILELFEDLQRVFEKALEKEILLCEPANVESELVLNKQNTTRWKIAFEQIVKNIHNVAEFRKEIDQLTELNKYNPSIENIYFDASKHIAKQDPLLALEYYLRYIKADLDSATINNKPLNKTTLKVLFKNQQQLDQFNVILDDFLKTKDFERALKELQGIYQVKRKEIKLDFEKISDVKKQLNETVELLNEYLEDEDIEPELDTSLLEQLATKPKQENLFNEDLGYSTHEIELLQMIRNFNNEITRELVEEFASENGMFVDSLINDINEKTYELIDDNLIEEQEDTYTIEEQYYQNILK